ncbi:structural protein [Vibrio viridaestus]|uniref:Structural protein n=1 Tax=Vibrio viridaestus TaxID=2487322 RepID=A0A3N9U067_9VIBR|nr:structural protein [Vibrio viridaestus]RQW61036.1 structural protein [Vibrio viridaestus]
MPRGIRNNNPGNIRKASFSWVGEVSQDNAGYVIFDTAAHGIRAMYRVLLTYRNKYGLNTVKGIINRWAPTSENDTQSYINHVASVLGVSVDTPLVLAQYPALIKVIIKHENGIQPYSDKVISDGIASA